MYGLTMPWLRTGERTLGLALVQLNAAGEFACIGKQWWSAIRIQMVVGIGDGLRYHTLPPVPDAPPSGDLVGLPPTHDSVSSRYLLMLALSLLSPHQQGLSYLESLTL